MRLPDITMVFAIVDNGKGFAAKNRRDARRVHDVCAACIRTCLRSVAGGYLCRMQVGNAVGQGAGWGGGLGGLPVLHAGMFHT